VHIAFERLYQSGQQHFDLVGEIDTISLVIIDLVGDFDTVRKSPDFCYNPGFTNLSNESLYISHT